MEISTVQSVGPKEKPQGAVGKQVNNLISPYGGKLVDLVVQGEERETLLSEATALESIQLSARCLCDLEVMATGGLSPLDRFMGQADYESVLDNMRLANGIVVPIPITLPVKENNFSLGQRVALRNAQNNLLAVMTVEDIYAVDLRKEMTAVLGTTDLAHPLVPEMANWGTFNLSGQIQVVNLPVHYDFVELRRTPAQVRDVLAAHGCKDVVAFQTRNPIHRAHEELTKRAAEQVGGALLIHPAVGLTKPGDVDHFSRVRGYKTLVENYYDKDRTFLALLPIAMRMAGPREALWHMIIRRNYGANHMIIGRDHAGLGMDATGRPFYGPYDSQDLVRKFEDDIGVKMLPFKVMVYLPDEDRYEEAERVATKARVASISSARVRTDYLDKGILLPDWFTRPETAKILAQVHAPLKERGFCIWFTGLSGAGKSTIADILAIMLMEHGRQVTLLDGDVVRTHLSKGLGFSKEDRETNVRRIGFVAAEITRHRGVVICAAISPYRAIRDEARRMVGDESFIEVFVDTALEVCESRDTKGMYAKARAGEIKEFTGIDDPYEAPIKPEIILTTTDCSPEENARKIISYLAERGNLGE